MSKARCPKGHTEGLQIRKICDFPVSKVSVDGIVEFDEKQPPADIDYEADMLGTSSGVWCPSCNDWYTEEAVAEASEDGS